MKDKAPLGNPFIGDPRGGGQPMWPVPLNFVPKEDSGGERREKVAGRPPINGQPVMLGLHSIPMFILHFILLLSYSLH
jgi:hypothetical protein